MRMQDSPGYLGKGDEMTAIQDYLWKGNMDYFAADLVRPVPASCMPSHSGIRPACRTCHCCSLACTISNVCPRRVWFSAQPADVLCCHKEGCLA